MHAAPFDPLFPERPVPSAAGDVPSAAWDVHAAVRDVLAPAEDVPFAKRAARSSRGAVPSAAEDLDASLWAVPSSDLPAPSPAEDLPFAQRTARSSRRAMHAAPFDPLFPERPVPSGAGDVHATVRDRGDSSEARYAALAKRSAQTADRLLRRVSRHRAKGK